MDIEAPDVQQHGGLHINVKKLSKAQTSTNFYT